MYQANSTGRKPDNVASIDGLVDAMKQAQARAPSTRFELLLDGAEFSVALLSSGYLELDGKVPPLDFERELDRALAASGATLKLIN